MILWVGSDLRADWKNGGLRINTPYLGYEKRRFKDKHALPEDRKNGGLWINTPYLKKMEIEL